MVTEEDVAEQVAYYRAIANEYEDHAIDRAGGDELDAALAAFNATGDVLELACGPGKWTDQLMRTAASLTAVDVAPEMLARAQARVGTGQVRFIEADLLSWSPDRTYDAVLFGFLLSHVPAERFESFWSLVAHCLAPGGRVFFMDDNHRTAEELVEGPDSPIVERLLNDGSAYRVIKIPYQADRLEVRLCSMGWDISVVATSGPFYWGQGTAPAVTRSGGPM